MASAGTCNNCGAHFTYGADTDEDRLMAQRIAVAHSAECRAVEIDCDHPAPVSLRVGGLKYCPNCQTTIRPLGTEQQ